jgi:hypothetical protein
LVEFGKLVNAAAAAFLQVVKEQTIILHSGPPTTAHPPTRPGAICAPVLGRFRARFLAALGFDSR